MVEMLEEMLECRQMKHICQWEANNTCILCISLFWDFNCYWIVIVIFNGGSTYKLKLHGAVLSCFVEWKVSWSLNLTTNVRANWLVWNSTERQRQKQILETLQFLRSWVTYTQTHPKGKVHFWPLTSTESKGSYPYKILVRTLKLSVLLLVQPTYCIAPVCIICFV